MEGYSVREHFMDRIYGEYQEYKASVLSCPNAEIFGRCYEIDVMVNFYEILVDIVDSLAERTITALLQRKNILTELYNAWLKKDDCNYREMESHVKDEAENMTEKFTIIQKGESHGKKCGCGKAAECG